MYICRYVLLLHALFPIMYYNPFTHPYVTHGHCSSRYTNVTFSQSIRTHQYMQLNTVSNYTIATVQWLDNLSKYCREAADPSLHFCFLFKLFGITYFNALYKLYPPYTLFRSTFVNYRL